MRPPSATRAASRPDLPSSEAAIEAILEAAERAGHRERVAIALDPATSEVYSDGAYRFEGTRVRRPASSPASGPTSSSRYPIVSIEDGAAEDDWAGVGACRRRSSATACSSSATTSSSRTPSVSGAASSEGVANSILVKVNQIGTLTETLETIRMAQAAGYTAVISHRSGETEDTTIADLAVATNAGQIKTGAPARSDRVAKYNQLLRIEEELGDRAVYPGWAAFPRARARLEIVAELTSAERRSSRPSGPPRRSHETVRALVEAGMDAARLNFSHGSQRRARAGARARPRTCRRSSAGRSR